MEVKICPNCGSHNLATASFCANKNCEELLTGVNVVEMNDDKIHLVTELSRSAPRKDTPLPRYNAPKSAGRTFALGCLGLSVGCCCLANLVNPDLYDQYVGSGTKTADFFLFSFIGLLIAFIIWVVWFWVWTVIDVFRNEPDTNNSKILWALLTIVMGVLGCTLYLLIRRPQRIATFGH